MLKVEEANPDIAWETQPFLEKILAVAPGIIYVFNHLTQSNEFANRNVGAHLGFSPQEVQAMGDALFPTLMHPDDLPLLGGHFADLQALEDGEVGQIEYRIRHKNGGWRWLLSRDAVFERDESGTLIRHIGVATDVTKQKEAEVEAIARQREADAASEELRSFAYSVSHDIKSPSNTMRLILSELEISAADTLDDEGKALVSLGLETVHRMQELIEDVLSYTRIVGEAQVVSRFDLSDEVTSVVEAMSDEIALCGATIEVGPLAHLRATRSQIRVVIENLLSNALKYRKPDVSPRVVIKTLPTDDPKVCTLQVTDNGIGIPAAAFDRIFAPFARLHLRSDFSGSGLGLAICRRVALAHGGDIKVTSTVNEGTTFQMTLPAAESPSKRPE